ncbi:MAG: hypothetical protein Q4F21_09330 [Lachnospiraceae bacterium]|nr:hypothetical protein [Lachnospiraceae bacterium]
MIRKSLPIILLLLISIATLTACGSLRNTAEKNKKLNETLPYYELNTADYSEISYNDITYIITDICLDKSDLQEEIGQVSKRFKNVEGTDFSFGYVYRITNVDVETSVAVNINNEYRQANVKSTAD